MIPLFTTQNAQRKTCSAIACASGSFKCVFVHGVLSAFEEAGLHSSAYGATSASVLPVAAAAVGMARELGVGYWLRGIEIAAEPGNGMSDVMLAGIASVGPRVRPKLFAPDASRFLISTSAVVTDEAAELTQGERASRIGRQLLLDMARGNREWVAEHLRPVLFDTEAADTASRLSADNFDAVAYASTRMLHAWKTPAWIGGDPYIDGSYTCACPAVELAERGYDEVIAIAIEPGEFYRDLFTDRPMPSSHNGRRIHILRPDVDPKEMGVGFTQATSQGLHDVYQHGFEKGEEFLHNIYTP